MLASRTLAAFALSFACGCVIHASDWPGGDEPEVSYECDPSLLEPGATQLVQVYDTWDNTDFDKVYELRPIGDFDIAEWSPDDDALNVVIEVWPEAQGEQTLAIDSERGTQYATFDIQ